MNISIKSGRLVRDPDVRYSKEGTPIARFTLAVNRPFKNEKGEFDADFIQYVGFKKNAEFIEKYLKKGTKIIVNSWTQTGSYKDKDGVTRYTVDEIVERMEFCEPIKK